MKSLKKGFTLVELMVVIVIIGILAALAIPRFLGATNKSKATEFKPVLKQIYTLETAFQQERTDGRYGSLENIGWDPPGFNGPVATATATTALFSYNIGNTTINGSVGDQRTAMSVGSAAGIVIAANASLAIATVNDNGVVSMKSSTGAPLVMGTDNVCVVTSGELHMPATSVNLVTIAGAVPTGTCP